ncbi:MAG: hypothetical protein M3Z31_02055 [Pseudomonadota bacterium]|nr:hypothetical protein [Pseudomonadota bacterium]
MKSTLAAVLLFLATTSRALACDCYWSEISHGTFGAILAGATTAGVDRYWPEQREHRALIGFGASVFVGFAGEGIQRLNGGRFSLLDAGSHAVGSAVGAFITDRFILAPVVSRSASARYIGVSAELRF